MYLELLEKTVVDYMSANKAVNPITISLTKTISKALHLELNARLKIDSLVPIESITVASIKLHGRTITIKEDRELDETFEAYLIQQLSELVE